MFSSQKVEERSDYSKGELIVSNPFEFKILHLFAKMCFKIGDHNL